MALKYPLANGNWSNAANWNDGTLPIAGDDVRANGFTVTIDQDIDVERISVLASSPAVAGGSFVVSTNRSLICDIYGGTTVCLSSTAGVTVNIIGTIYGGSTSSISAVNFSNAGSVLNITGNAFSGTGNQVNHGITFAGTLDFTGNVFGANTGFNNVSAISVPFGANLFFNGNITGGGSIAQNVDGIRTAGNCTINGNIYAGTAGNCHGLRILGGACTINADCYGGGVSSSNAVQVSTATATFNGNIFGSTSALSFGLNVIDAASNVVISTMTFSANGGSPVGGFVKFKNTAPTITVLKENNTTQQLVDPSTTDTPIETDVRDGVSYASGALTGTLKVPPSTAVSVGVPTDNTVGTAIITITDMGALLSSYVV